MLITSAPFPRFRIPFTTRVVTWVLPDVESVVGGSGTPTGNTIITGLPESANTLQKIVTEMQRKINRLELDANNNGKIDAAVVERYIHEQSTPSKTWTIDHALGFTPSITTVSNNSQIFGDVRFNNSNTTIITFARPIIGIATLS